MPVNFWYSSRFRVASCPAFEVHVSDVVVVHDTVPHLVEPRNIDGVRLTPPKLVPKMLIGA
jgi:hypothetical protein